MAVAAVPALMQASQSADLAVQHEAVIALGRIGPEASAALPRLVELVAGKSVILQYSACQSIRRIAVGSNDRRVLRVLRRVAAGDQPLLAVPAAWALVSVRPNDEKLLTNALPVLSAGLKSASSQVAADAVGALGQIGKPAVSAVLGVMDDGSSQIVCNGCDALAGMGLDGESAVGRLIALTQSDDARACRHAARALGMIGCLPDRSVPALSKLLAHKNAGVRINAAQALGAFSSEAARAVPELIKALGADDAHLKRVAARSLGEIGPAANAAVPALNQALDSPEGSVVLNAVEALGQIGAPAVGALAKRLSDPKVAILAIAELSDLGPVAAPAVPALTRMLQSQDQTTRVEATIALANIGPAARSAVPVLMRRLKSTQDVGRGAAAFALGKLGAKSAVDDLKQALKDSDPRVRMASAYALTMLDAEHRGDLQGVLPVLIEHLGHKMPLIRREMADAIGLLGKDAVGAIPALSARASSDTDAMVRASALHALTEIGPTDRRVLTAALTALNDEDTGVRRTAAYALGRQGQLARSAVPDLRQMLRHRNRFDRAIAAWALVKIAPQQEFKQEAIGLLVEAIEAENPLARLELAKVLGELGADPRSRQALEKLRTDSDPQVRAAATSALKSLK